MGLAHSRAVGRETSPEGENNTQHARRQYTTFTSAGQIVPGRQSTHVSSIFNGPPRDRGSTHHNRTYNQRASQTTPSLVRRVEFRDENVRAPRPIPQPQRILPQQDQTEDDDLPDYESEEDAPVRYRAAQQEQLNELLEENRQLRNDLAAVKHFSRDFELLAQQARDDADWHKTDATHARAKIARMEVLIAKIHADRGLGSPRGIPVGDVQWDGPPGAHRIPTTVTRESVNPDEPRRAASCPDQEPTRIRIAPRSAISSPGQPDHVLKGRIPSREPFRTDDPEYDVEQYAEYRDELDDPRRERTRAVRHELGLDAEQEDDEEDEQQEGSRAGGSRLKRSASQLVDEMLAASRKRARTQSPLPDLDEAADQLARAVASPEGAQHGAQPSPPRRSRTPVSNRASPAAPAAALTTQRVTRRYAQQHGIEVPDVFETTTPTRQQRLRRRGGK